MTIPAAVLDQIRNRQERAAFDDQLAIEVLVKRDVPALLLAVADLTAERDELAKLVDSEAVAELRAENARLGRAVELNHAGADYSEGLLRRQDARIAELERMLARSDADHRAMDARATELEAQRDKVLAESAEALSETLFDWAHENCDEESGCTGGGKPWWIAFVDRTLMSVLRDIYAAPTPSLGREPGPHEPCTHWAHYTSGTQLHATSKQLAVDHLSACPWGPAAEDLADIERRVTAEKAVLEAAQEWRTVEAEGIAAGRPTVYGEAHAAHAIRRLERAVDGLAGIDRTFVNEGEAS